MVQMEYAVRISTMHVVQGYGMEGRVWGAVPQIKARTKRVLGQSNAHILSKLYYYIKLKYYIIIIL
jgi:hypothetical protein